MEVYLLIGLAAVPSVILVWAGLRYLRRATDAWSKVLAWSFLLALAIQALKLVVFMVLPRFSSVLKMLADPVASLMAVTFVVALFMKFRAAFPSAIDAAPSEQALQPDASKRAHDGKE